MNLPTVDVVSVIDPTIAEIQQEIIDVIPEGFEYVSLKLTRTMLEKSVIDASYKIRKNFSDTRFVDYDTIGRGPDGKVKKKGIIKKGIIWKHVGISIYKPKAKGGRVGGDPRLWISGLNNYCVDGDVILLLPLSSEELLVIIPCEDGDNEQELLSLKNYLLERSQRQQ